MPLSIWAGMEDALEAITASRPLSVLDAGIGFGLWGHLLRQYLDVWSGRIQPEEWATRIDGIEIDEKRVQEHSRRLYTNIYIGDIRELVPKLASERAYDVILYGDVLEHLPKEDARFLLKASVELASDLVVIRIPLGDGWRREGREPPDHHRSQWRLEDFAGFGGTVRQYDFWGNPYGLVVIPAAQRRTVKLVELESRLESLERRLERLLREERVETT